MLRAACSGPAALTWIWLSGCLKRATLAAARRLPLRRRAGQHAAEGASPTLGTSHITLDPAAAAAVRGRRMPMIVLMALLCAGGEVAPARLSGGWYRQ